MQDHLGSTIALADDNGAVTGTTAYDSFDNATNPSIATRYQFTGREHDDFTGLQYSRARWYDPQIGKFISEDPIGFDGGDINLYGYVKNNPVKYTDPLGLIDPIVYQDPIIYPSGNSKLRDLSCALGNKNPWIGPEVGFLLHLIPIGGGGGASAGFEINPLTLQFCLFTKTNVRIGVGLYAGVGGKINVGLGPETKNDGSDVSVEPAGDIAVGKGVKGSVKPGSWWRNFSGSLSSDPGIGYGVGPSAGLGASVGVDVVKKYTWCWNNPEPCVCR